MKRKIATLGVKKGLRSAPGVENARERKAIAAALRAGESGWNVEGRGSVATGCVLLVFLLGSRANRETLPPFDFPNSFFTGIATSEVPRVRFRHRFPRPRGTDLILLFRALHFAGAPRRPFVKSAAPVGRSTRFASGPQPFRLARSVHGLAEGRAGRFAAFGKLRELRDGCEDWRINEFDRVTWSFFTSASVLLERLRAGIWGFFSGVCGGCTHM